MVRKPKVPARITSPKLWRRVIKETFFALGDKNLGTLAAGIAFFATLSFFPFIATLVAISGIVLEPHQMTDIAQAIGAYLPQDIAHLITTQLTNATQNKAGNVFVAFTAFTLAIFSISGAVNTAMTAANVAYGVKETRTYIRVKLIGMLWTLGIIIAMAILLPVLFVNDSFLQGYGFNESAISMYLFLRWVVLFVLVVTGLAYFYHYGPNRARTPFQWLSWGAFVATIMWLIVTGAFFIYLQYFANFSNSYSLFAGIIAMMGWLNLSSFVILVGAEINYRLDSYLRPNLAK
jgi:membrane protein